MRLPRFAYRREQWFLCVLRRKGPALSRRAFFFEGRAGILIFLEAPVLRKKIFALGMKPR